MPASPSAQVGGTSISVEHSPTAESRKEGDGGNHGFVAERAMEFLDALQSGTATEFVQKARLLSEIGNKTPEVLSDIAKVIHQNHRALLESHGFCARGVEEICVMHLRR